MANAQGYVFDPQVIERHLPDLAQGLLHTFTVSIVAIIAAVLIGLLFGAARAYRTPILSQIGAAYVALFRGTPILVQIFFLYYALPDFGIRLGVFPVGVLALALWGGSYNVENFRGAFGALPAGAMQAASALGMPGHLRFIWIALPLVFRIALPSLCNTSISILKDSAYLSVIAFAELTYVATNIVATEFRVFEMFSVLAATYLILVLLLSWGLSHLMACLARSGTVGDQ